MRRLIISLMTQEAQELLKKALALPDTERAAMAGRLIKSLEPAVDEDIEAVWQQEVSRRLEDVRSGKVKTIAWDEIREKGHTLLHGE